VGVGVGVAGGVGVATGVGAAVGVGVAVAVGEAVGVGEPASIGEAVGVAVPVGVAGADGEVEPPAAPAFDAGGAAAARPLSSPDEGGSWPPALASSSAVAPRSAMGAGSGLVLAVADSSECRLTGRPPSVGAGFDPSPLVMPNTTAIAVTPAMKRSVTAGVIKTPSRSLFISTTASPLSAPQLARRGSAFTVYEPWVNGRLIPEYEYKSYKAGESCDRPFDLRGRPLLT